MLILFSFKRGTERNKSILDTLTESRGKKVEENKELQKKTVTKVLLLTATLNIVQRGHGECDYSIKKGNFLSILDEIAKHDPFIVRRLDACGSAKYTRHQIKNEILQELVEMVLQKLAKLKSRCSDKIKCVRSESYQLKSCNLCLFHCSQRSQNVTIDTPKGGRG